MLAPGHNGSVAAKTTEEKREHGGSQDVWSSRRGAGTTPYQERLDYSAKDYSRDASTYHTPPPIYDWPIQAMNPLLYKPNPVCLHQESVCLAWYAPVLWRLCAPQLSTGFTCSLCDLSSRCSTHRRFSFLCSIYITSHKVGVPAEPCPEQPLIA